MRLDRENGRYLGVCAGIANWLDVPATLVRIVFVICVIAWPPLLLGYFVLWFCLDKDFTPDQLRDYFSNTPTAAHFRRLNYRKPIYRNEYNKRIAGVCSGLADYLEVSAFSVRLVTLLSLFVFGPFTFWGYIICWFVMEADPAFSHDDRSQRKKRRRERRAQRRYAREQHRQARRSGNNGYVNAEAEAAEPASNNFTTDSYADTAHSAGNTRSGTQCSQLYSELEQRLRDIEAFMTSKRFRLHCEINRI